MKRRTIYIILIIINLFAVISSCKKKEKTAPPIPPIESIMINLSYFDPAAIEGSNFEFAKESLTTWAAILYDSLLFHHNFYETIEDQILVYQSEDTWLINKDVDITENKFNLKFFEIVNFDTVSSKLFISKFYLNADSFIYENKLLMDGETFNNNVNGNWTINKPDTANTYIKFLIVNWKVKNTINPDIKITNTLSRGDNNGNYIFYKDSVDSGYNSYLLLYDNSDENITTIQWNSQTKKGRIKDLNFYGNEDWYCWDEIQQDIVCP